MDRYTGLSALRTLCLPGGIILLSGLGITSATADDVPVFSLDTNSLTFTAATPNAKDPPSQYVTATITGGSPSGTLYVLINKTGIGVSSVRDFTINGNGGRGTVTVVQPVNLASGTYNSTITVRACLNDSTCATGELAGSPQVVNVTYTIGALPVTNGVMPQVVAAGSAGRVIIRGNGFTGVTGVSFGSTPATSFLRISNTEIQANYPATLAAGTYPVTLTGGPASFSGSLTIVSQQPYTAQTLALPETPLRINSALYDAKRSALLVCAAFQQSSSNKLWRYTWSPETVSWSAPEVIAIPELSDVAFTPDGSRLVAVTGYSILELDAANPGGGTLRSVAGPYVQGAPNEWRYLRRIEMANDGTAYLTTGGGGWIPNYMYSSVDGSLIELNSNFQTYTLGTGTTPLLAASADGSRVMALQNGISPPRPILEYNPSTAKLANASLSFNQWGDYPATMDATGNKLGVWYGILNQIYSRDYRLLGYIPLQRRLMQLNPQGTRAYVLNSSGLLRTYDVTANVNGFAYPEIGTGVTLAVPASSGSTVLTVITPDGRTLFFVGDGGIAVVPVTN